MALVVFARPFDDCNRSAVFCNLLLDARQLLGRSNSNASTHQNQHLRVWLLGLAGFTFCRASARACAWFHNLGSNLRYTIPTIHPTSARSKSVIYGRRTLVASGLRRTDATRRHSGNRLDCRHASRRVHSLWRDWLETAARSRAVKAMSSSERTRARDLRFGAGVARQELAFCKTLLECKRLDTRSALFRPMKFFGLTKRGLHAESSRILYAHKPAPLQQNSPR